MLQSGLVPVVDWCLQWTGACSGLVPAMEWGLQWPGACNGELATEAQLAVCRF